MATSGFATPQLIEIFDRTNEPALRLAAVQGLGRVGGGFAIAKLLQISASTNDPKLKAACVLAISKAGEHMPVPDTLLSTHTV